MGICSRARAPLLRTPRRGGTTTSSLPRCRPLTVLDISDAFETFCFCASRPLRPEEYNWEAHYPEFFEKARAKGGDAAEKPMVRFADVGCGFGGLLVRLSPLFPDQLAVGREDSRPKPVCLSRSAMTILVRLRVLSTSTHSSRSLCVCPRRSSCLCACGREYSNDTSCPRLWLDIAPPPVLDPCVCAA